MSCNLLPEGVASKATGGFERRCYQPIKRFRRFNEANQQPLPSSTLAERLFVPDGAVASCVGANVMHSGLQFTSKAELGVVSIADSKHGLIHTKVHNTT